MLEEVIEVIASGFRRGARDAPAARVAVDLLRPEADRPLHVEPERRVAEPRLHRRLVGGGVVRPVHDADDEDRALRRTTVAFIEAADERARIIPGLAEPAPDTRRELVDGPRVSLPDVVPGCTHAAPGLDAGVEPRAARRTDPLLPGRPVDLSHRVEARPQRPDAPRLVRAGHRLVRDERRNGDVVVGARRGVLRKLRRQTKPVTGGVEDELRGPTARDLRRRAQAEPRLSGPVPGVERCGAGPIRAVDHGQAAA